MKNKAVPHPVHLSFAAAMALALAAACLLAFGATPSPAKKLVGKDGRVYACYKVKGKPRGAVRLVAKKGKCRRGERKLNWSVSGPTGQAGTGGSSGGGQGSSGAQGADGSAGTSGVVGLESQVLKLSAKIDALEGILHGVDNSALTKALDTVNGVTNSDLTGVVDKLQGITGGELQEAVAAVPAVELLCDQADTLTDTLNALRLGVSGIEILGVPVGLGSLPGAVTDFTCSP